jgi:hypothetical protein
MLMAMDLLNQNFLWASCIWGVIGSGYFIYGWRQKAAIPLLGGAVMGMASYFAPTILWMSLICLAAMILTHWLMKQDD